MYLSGMMLTPLIHRQGRIVMTNEGKKNNGCRIYVDIVIRKNCSQFKLLFARRGGKGYKGGGEVMGSLFYPETSLY